MRFNVASFEANLGDWGWVLAEVDPAFDVEDANAFINRSGSGAVYTRFSEGCWFYFGQASVLDKPFLCSRDPDPELSALQSSTLNEPYQYGSLEFYSAASGNLSIWYAMDEQFDFAMVHNYYTCGIDLFPPNSSVVRLRLSLGAGRQQWPIQCTCTILWLQSRRSGCAHGQRVCSLLCYILLLRTSFERLARPQRGWIDGVVFSADLTRPPFVRRYTQP